MARKSGSTPRPVSSVAALTKPMGAGLLMLMLLAACSSPPTGEVAPEDTEDAPPDEPEALSAAEEAAQKTGYSSGERQLQVLREIVANTDSPLYLLDEWDANLDAPNRAAALALVETLARRARVVEISHRDRR